MSISKKLIEYLIWCSGVSPAIAANLNKDERSKAVFGGVVVLIPALLSLFTVPMAMGYVTDSTVLQFLIGAFAAFVIFIVDRSIMASAINNYLLMGSRFFMIVCLSFLISEPILLRMMDQDINEHLASEVRASQIDEAIPYEIKIEKLKSELTEGEDRLNYLQKQYTQEMDGTGGSGYRNPGPIYRKKLSDYKKYESQWSSRRTHIEAEIAGLKEKIALVGASIETNASDGLFARIMAMHEFVRTNAAAKASVWVLRIILILIDLSVIMYKLQSSLDIRKYELMMEEESTITYQNGANLRMEELKADQRLEHAKSMTEKIEEQTKQKVANEWQKRRPIIEGTLNAALEKQQSDEMIRKSIKDEATAGKLYELSEKLLDEFLNMFKYPPNSDKRASA